MVDLTKAFDTVNHELLLNKLEQYRIRETAHSLLSSYLTNRMQYIDLNKFNSSFQRIKYGVSQGSTPSPLLFLIFINDITNATIIIPRLYADDTCLILNDHSPKQLQHNINNELAKVFLWARLNKLTINPSKLLFLIIPSTIKKATTNLKLYLDSTNLNTAKNLKYLGVIIDNKLFFNDHINYINHIVSRGVGIITKLKHLLPIRNLRNKCFVLIHSYFN